MLALDAPANYRSNGNILIIGASASSHPKAVISACDFALSRTLKRLVQWSILSRRNRQTDTADPCTAFCQEPSFLGFCQVFFDTECQLF